MGRVSSNKQGIIKYKGFFYRIKFDGDILKWEATPLLKLLSFGMYVSSFEFPVNVIHDYQVYYVSPFHRILKIELIHPLSYSRRNKEKRSYKVVRLQGANVFWMSRKLQNKIFGLMESCKGSNVYDNPWLSVV